MLKRNNIEQETVIQKKQKPEDAQEIVLEKDYYQNNSFLLFPKEILVKIYFFVRGDKDIDCNFASVCTYLRDIVFENTRTLHLDIRASFSRQFTSLDNLSLDFSYLQETINDTQDEESNPFDEVDSSDSEFSESSDDEESNFSDDEKSDHLKKELDHSKQEEEPSSFDKMEEKIVEGTITTTNTTTMLQSTIERNLWDKRKELEKKKNQIFIDPLKVCQNFLNSIDFKKIKQLVVSSTSEYPTCLNFFLNRISFENLESLKISVPGYDSNANIPNSTWNANINSKILKTLYLSYYIKNICSANTLNFDNLESLENLSLSEHSVSELKKITPNLKKLEICNFDDYNCSFPILEELDVSIDHDLNIPAILKICPRLKHIESVRYYQGELFEQLNSELESSDRNLDLQLLEINDFAPLYFSNRLTFNQLWVYFESFYATSFHLSELDFLNILHVNFIHIDLNSLFLDLKNLTKLKLSMTEVPENIQLNLPSLKSFTFECSTTESFHLDLDQIVPNIIELTILSNHHISFSKVKSSSITKVTFNFKLREQNLKFFDFPNVKIIELRPQNSHLEKLIREKFGQAEIEYLYFE